MFSIHDTDPDIFDRKLVELPLLASDVWILENTLWEDPFAVISVSVVSERLPNVFSVCFMVQNNFFSHVFLICVLLLLDLSCFNRIMLKERKTELNFLVDGLDWGGRWITVAWHLNGKQLAFHDANDPEVLEGVGVAIG